MDKGSLVFTLLYWGLFPIPHLPSSHLLSPLTKRFYKDSIKGHYGDVESLGFTQGPFALSAF